MDNLLYRVTPYFDIDTKLKLGITPKKLPLSVISNLESKFPRPEVVYLTEHKKVFNFVLAHLGRIIVLANIGYQGLYNHFHWFYSEHMAYGVYDKTYFFVGPTEDKHWVTDLTPKII
jgi:hypothetical protein